MGGAGDAAPYRTARVRGSHNRRHPSTTIKVVAAVSVANATIRHRRWAAYPGVVGQVAGDRSSDRGCDPVSPVILTRVAIGAGGMRIAVIHHGSDPPARLRWYLIADFCRAFEAAGHQVVHV